MMRLLKKATKYLQKNHMSKIKLGKTGVEVIKEWVIKTFLKQQPKGVLTTLPKKDFVDLNTAITAERLMRNGVDPNAIKNVDQVENIINQLNKPRAVAADSPEGKGITEALFGKKGEVFNIQGEKLDPSKPIVGGTQQGKKINREFFERDAAAKEVQQRIDSGVAATVEKMLAMDPIDAMKEASSVIGRRGQYKNLSEQDAKKILQDTEDHIFERNIKPKETDMDFDDNDFAEGGRIGFKKGMDRRTFMKYMAGLASIPVVGKFFKGAEVAAPVTQKVMENFSSKAPEAPAYFFDLMTKIKMFGKKSKIGPSDRVDEYSYTGKNGDEYTLTEDITTGDAQITKDKIGGRSYEEGSYDVIEDRTVMEYKAPKQDVDVETQKATNEAAEYEEYRVDFDQDGTEAGAEAVDEYIQKEIIEEAAEEAPSIKKASGGIARMLGE